jgi:thioesterase domain-containing protein
VTSTVAGPRTLAATAMQEALWWVHQRAKNQSVYNLTWRLACDAPVDAEALAVAFQSVVDRHEACRTSIVRDGDGRISQIVWPHLTVRPALVEVDDPGPAPGVLFQLIAEEVHEQAFVLDDAPLVRLTLVRLGIEYELLITVHHIVLDGWAIQLLVNELSEAYEAAADGEEPWFATEPVPFSVYVEELAAERDAGRWQPAIDHWKSTLDGAVSTTVAADRQRYAGTGAAGVTVRYAFSPEAAAGIGALAESSYTTPFAVVLAAMQIVLARGGAGPDVAIGVVVANRMTPRDQALVGYLANLCIAPARITGEDTVSDVVGRCRDFSWTMLAHQGVPYPAVFGALPEPTRAVLNDYAPLLLNYLGPIGTDLRLGEVGLRLHRSPNRAARSDIAIAFWEAGGYQAEIEYNTGRYDRETVLRLLHDLDDVLCADPGQSVASLSVRSKTVAGHVDHHRVEVAPAPGEALPESATWERVARIWEEVLGARPHGPDEDFFAVGGRSLKVIQLAAGIEADTGYSLDLIRWLSEPTPRRLVEALTTDTPAADTASTLVVLRDGSGGPHLHLVHGAGGSPTDYHHLLAALPADWRITLSQERDPLPSVPEMAARYRTDLDAAGPPPRILCGWSMGGQIAYAMAAAYGSQAPALAILDAAPPVGYENDAAREAERFGTFVASVSGSLGVSADHVPRARGENPELPMRVFAAYLAAMGQPVPAGTLIQRWSVYSRHTHAVGGFVSDAAVPTPTLLVAAGLLDVQVAQWMERLPGAVRRVRLPVGHYGVLGAEVAGDLAAAIGELA